MKVHFDPVRERAFHFDGNNSTEYFLVGNTIKSEKSDLFEYSLYRFCTSIESFDNFKLPQIEEKLCSFRASNYAQLVRNAIELYPHNADISDQLLLKIQVKALGQIDFVSHLYEQIVRSDETIKLFTGRSWKLKGLTSWKPYQELLNSQYSFSNAKKVNDCWQRLQYPIHASEEELFSRCRHSKFFPLLQEVTNNEVDLNTAYLSYCGLVGNIDRKCGTLEKHFFEAFGGLSSQVKTKEKTYFRLIKHEDKLPKPTLDQLSVFLKESNEIRDGLEGELVNLAIKIRDERLIKNKLDKDELKKSLERILSDWKNVFNKSCVSSATALHAYFNSRHKRKPRITIKIIHQKGEAIILHTIFRDHKVNYPESSYLQQNTGFQFALRTGQPYLCNHVPAHYKAGIYNNPRMKALDELNNRKIPTKDRKQRQWLTFWKKPDKNSEDSSYKSTLIVPINITRSSVDSDVNESFDAEAMTAFYCIDHVAEGYFDPKTDIQVLESCAGLLRTYFTTRYSVFINTRIILKLVDKLRSKFPTVKVESNCQIREIELVRLKDSIVKADEKSDLSFVDYGLSHMADESPQRK